MTPSRKPGLIDVHSHFLPDFYVELARAHGHSAPDGISAWPAWNAEQHLEFMDERGIERSLLSVSSPGVALSPSIDVASLARQVNRFGADLAHAHPTRFGLLASLPLPDVDAAIAELDHALDSLGADGVILSTNAFGTYVTDPSHDPLWQALAERGCVVLLHPTSPAGWASTAMGLPRPMMEFLFDSTRAVIGLALAGTLARHPALKLVIPHSGALVPLLLDRAALIQFGMRMELDTDDPRRTEPGVTDAVKGLWWDLAGTPTATHIGTLTERFGTDRIVYGSDFCFTPPLAVSLQLQQLDQVADAAGLGSWRQRTRSNAYALLGHDADRFFETTTETSAQ